MSMKIYINSDKPIWEDIIELNGFKHIIESFWVEVNDHTVTEEGHRLVIEPPHLESGGITIWFDEDDIFKVIGSAFEFDISEKLSKKYGLADSGKHLAILLNVAGRGKSNTTPPIYKVSYKLKIEKM